MKAKGEASDIKAMFGKAPKHKKASARPVKTSKAQNGQEEVRTVETAESVPLEASGTAKQESASASVPDWKTGEGRESVFSVICDDIAKGITLRSICRREGMPSYITVYSWINGNDEYSKRFACARESGFDQIAEECISISDEHPRTTDNGGTDSGDVQHRKLQIETRLKLLAKWNPKKYGDKVDLNHAGELTINVNRGRAHGDN